MTKFSVVCTVMSTNTKLDADIAAMLATSAALTISGIPFNGPIGASTSLASMIESGNILNPSYSDLDGLC